MLSIRSTILFWKFQARNVMEEKFSTIQFQKFGYTLQGCPKIPENWNQKILFHFTVSHLGSVSPT